MICVLAMMAPTTPLHAGSGPLRLHRDARSPRSDLIGRIHSGRLCQMSPDVVGVGVVRRRCASTA